MNLYKSLQTVPRNIPVALGIHCNAFGKKQCACLSAAETASHTFSHVLTVGLQYRELVESSDNVLSILCSSVTKFTERAFSGKYDFGPLCSCI